MAKNDKSLATTTVQSNSKQIAKTSDVERAKVLAEANDDFRKLYTKIREQLTDEEQGVVRSRYFIGEMLEEASKDESTYGSNFVRRMEIVVGLERSVIYNSLLLVQRYDRDELEQLLDLRNKAGQPLLWTHVTHLIRIPDRQVREELISATLDGNLTPTQLLEFIQAKQGKGPGRQSSAGKPMARPKSLKGYLDQQYEMVQQLLRRKEKVWAGAEKPGDKCFFDLLDETPPNKIDRSFLTEMEQLQRLYESAAEHMDQMGSELLRARNKVMADIKKVKDNEEAEEEQQKRREEELERQADKLLEEAGEEEPVEQEDEFKDDEEEDTLDDLDEDDEDDKDDYEEETPAGKRVPSRPIARFARSDTRPISRK